MIDDAYPAIAPMEVVTPAKIEGLMRAGVIGGGGSAAALPTVENEIDLTAPHNAGIAAAQRRQQAVLTEQQILGIKHNSTRNINTVEARLKHAGAASKWISELVAAYQEQLAPLGGTVGSEEAALTAWCNIYGDIAPDSEFFDDFGIYATAIAKKQSIRPETIPCSLATFIREHTPRMDGAISFLDKAPTPAAPKPGSRAAGVNRTYELAYQALVSSGTIPQSGAIQ